MKTFKLNSGHRASSDWLRSARNCALSAALGLGSVRAAHAEVPARLSISTPGSCPTGADVARELTSIFPTLEVDVASDSAQASDVVIEEHADGVGVTFAGARRDVDDASARCAERAKQVAVLLALILDPPRLPPHDAAAPEPRPPAKTAPSSRPPPAGRRSPPELELGPLLAVAPTFSGTPLAAGAAVRIRVGGDLAFVGGATLLAPETLHYTRADAKQLLFPLDGGVRLTLRGPRWDLAAELSFAAAPVYLRGQYLSPSTGGWRVEIGGRGALSARYWATHRVGLLLSPTAFFWPQPVALTVAGAGTVGHTPPFWVGGELGLALRL